MVREIFHSALESDVLAATEIKIDKNVFNLDSTHSKFGFVL